MGIKLIVNKTDCNHLGGKLRRIWIATLFSTTVLAVTCGGCGVAGWAASVVATKKISVEAEYQGFNGKAVGVLVTVDTRTHYHHPLASKMVAKAIGAQLTTTVPGIRVADPVQVEYFQQSNPYWNTMSYSQLMQELNVERLLLIEVFSYSTHDPEHKHVWRGVIEAGIGVYEAESDDPDVAAYMNTTQAQYPNMAVALLGSDEPTIQFGLHSVFAQHVTRLFYDYEEVTRP